MDTQSLIKEIKMTKLDSCMQIVTRRRFVCNVLYLHVIWLNTANKKGVTSEIFATDRVSDLLVFISGALKND